MLKLALTLLVVAGSSATVLAPPLPLSVSPPEVGSISVAMYPKDKTQHALLDGELIVLGSDEKSLVARADNDGYYIVRSLLPGKYSVKATAPGYKPVSKTATVKKFESTEFDMTLLPK